MYDFGSRLKAIRKQRGLTQKELARRINKSVSAISSYESNVQMPPGDVLESLAYILNISLDYLIGFDQSEIYSTKNLTESQKEIIRLLFKEFVSPTSNNSALSMQQIEIVRKLFQCFSST